MIAPVAVSRVRSPLVALPKASDPSVPEAPSVGVAVNPAVFDAEELMI